MHSAGPLWRGPDWKQSVQLAKGRPWERVCVAILLYWRIIPLLLSITNWTCCLYSISFMKARPCGMDANCRWVEQTCCSKATSSNTPSSGSSFMGGVRSSRYSISFIKRCSKLDTLYSCQQHQSHHRLDDEVNLLLWLRKQVWIGKGHFSPLHKHLTMMRAH